MERLMAQSTETLPESAEKAEQDTAVDWLSPLEEKVRAAAERIQALKQENTALHRRIEDLEERLVAASSAPAAAAEDGTACWEEERREIRERVERLTRTLEEMAGV
jgi:predicted RNase H-like nuclease (RuvC/YqgF family)